MPLRRAMPAFTRRRILIAVSPALQVIQYDLHAVRAGAQASDALATPPGCSLAQRCPILAHGPLLGTWGVEARLGDVHHTADHTRRGAGPGLAVRHGLEPSARAALRLCGSDGFRRSMRPRRGMHVHCFSPTASRPAGRPAQTRLARAQPADRL